jgi:prepilin-type N-terminal cleavage/methylation domain-containing protein/prepilin-type processing-associated H-X9-DG protein
MHTLSGGERRAFTLIELLVVVAVIALLLAVLLPGLAHVRMAGRRCVCLSNQRQIGTALTVYANQYKEWVPREGTTDYSRGLSGVRARLPWPVALRPFLDDRAGPETDINDYFAEAPYYLDPARPKDNHRIHYVSNGMPFLGPGMVDPAAETDHRRRRGPTPLCRIPMPARTIYLTDFADDENGSLWALWRTYGNNDIDVAQFYDVWALSHIDPDLPSRRIETHRHGAGANAVYLDGHGTMVAARDLADVEAWDDLFYRR